MVWEVSGHNAGGGWVERSQGGMIRVQNTTIVVTGHILMIIFNQIEKLWIP